jgi:tetratricopeptide (TPR) repeat protein
MRGYKYFSTMLAIAAMSYTFIGSVQAQSLDDSLLSIENRWASVAFETDGKQKGRELRMLLDDVRGLHRLFPDKPEAAAWHGIVAQSYMDIKSSMSIAKEARDALLVAESIDPLVLDGQVYAHLGALYSKAPSGFGGFGSKTRGIGYLWKALTVDPHGIDANYLYAELLYKEKNYAAARDALIRASEAPMRPEHPEADGARKMEVRNLLAAVDQKLGDQG